VADAAGSAYVTGGTSSPNFPTANPLQATKGFASDVFVTKFSPSGSGLLYSTYLGGGDTESARGIALDPSGNVYLTGSTVSVDFPVTAGTLRNKSPLFKSNDGAGHWGHDNYGLSANVVLNLALDPQNPATLYAGTFNGPFKSLDGGHTWVAINNGLLNATITAIAVDPVTSATLYVGVGLSNVGPNGGIYKSVNGGNTWASINTGITSAGVSSLAIDKNAPSTLYAGLTSGIFKSTNGGSNWTQSNNGLSSPSISALAIDPSNSAIVYAGGGFYRSTDSGANWNISQTGLSGNISHIRIDPANTSVIYASGDGGAFKSTNAGLNWSPLNQSTHSGDIAIASSSTIYLSAGSGSTGVFKSVDGGANFVPVTSGLDRIFVGPLLINPLNDSQIYAGGNSPLDVDAFVIKISPSGTALTYSTLLGGFADPSDSSGFGDVGFGIAVDASGHAYITGQTHSVDFPTTPGVFQPLPAGGSFVSKLIPSYVISGIVVGENSLPVSGVAVTLNGPQLSAVTTGSYGSYSFSALREGDTFTISASKPGFTFTPAHQTFGNLTNNQTVNFVAHPTNALFFTISGHVTSNGAGLSGANGALAGSQSGLTTTDGNGGYSFTLPGGGNYTVTPSLLGYSFSPGSQSFNNLTSNQVGDFAGTRLNLVVKNADDSGAGSLRQALIDANSIPGADTIVFNIPGSGTKTITVSISLPAITEAVVIDGTTQPGYAGTPLIEINGNGGDANKYGLKFTAGNCTVRGLAINHFGGFGLWFSNSNNNVIQGNYIGVDSTGTIRRANNYGIVMTGDHNLIGGTSTAARNIISANNSYGVSIGGANNVVQGNFIGTDVTGTVALGNGIEGLDLSSGSGQLVNNLVGGTVVGARNVISGNTNYNLVLRSAGNVIQGNFIGTDVTGTAKLSSNATGIDLEGDSNLIGGTTAEARNIISGNGGAGIFWNGFGGSLVRIQGNFIGTDLTGLNKVANGTGISASGSAILIGGSGPGTGNLISGNDSAGVAFSSSNAGHLVQGNLIGTDVTGNAALGNGTRVSINASGSTLGGSSPGMRNVISGNQVGVQIGGQSFPGPGGNFVQGNYIGLNSEGNQSLPNLQNGIVISGSSNNTIGGTNPNQRNKIVSNGGAGVLVNAGNGNLVRGNAISGSTNLGIDLLSNNHTGITNNDNCDADSGANNLQNYPVLSSATSTNTTTTVQGTLNSTANTIFTIEFFTNTACDSSGFGEAQQSLGTTVVTTDANCVVGFIVNLPFGVGGQFVTATATDPNGNTSELSSCIQVTGVAGPTVQFGSSNYSAHESSGSATITVTRSGNTSGAVSVDYATSDDSAHQNGEYTLTSGSLTFAAGETSKSFAVLISKDAYLEGNEKLHLTLGNPTGGAILGPIDAAPLTITDDLSVPGNSQPLDDSGNFVTQHYSDFLSRGPDQGGFSFWTGVLNQCGSDQTCLRNKRIDVSNAFFYELEYQQTGSYVYRLYRVAFGNNQPFPNPVPDPNNLGEEKKVVSYDAFVQDRAGVVGGSSLAQSQLDLANAFVLRAEFLTKYPATLDGPGFVDAVLGTVKNDIGVDLTAQRPALINLFNSGGRGAVIYRLADDNTQTNSINNRAFIDAEYNRAFVATQYFGYLRRDPDMAGFLFWLGQVSSAPLRDVTKQHEMVCSFITKLNISCDLVPRSRTRTRIVRSESDALGT
jgi:hypothetical protein